MPATLVTLHDFLPGDDSSPTGQQLVVRTPKRAKSRYVAQVWGEGGYWVIGEYTTIREARHEARAFASTGPTEPVPGTPRAELPPNWFRHRSDSRAPLYKWTRRVKGNAVQSRPWLGAGRGSLNLGLCTVADHGEHAERAAGLISRAFMREWKDGRTVAEVVELLKHSKKLSERVLAHIVVPERQRDLRPSSDNGPMKSKDDILAEKLDRTVTLADFLSAV